MKNDLSVIYYTANELREDFALCVRGFLVAAISDLPLISVSKKPIKLGKNIVVNNARSHLGIYEQALVGAYEADTKYIALVEDDVLYTSEHFKYRPSPGKFAYNLGMWGVYTWVKPALFSWKGRRNLSQLICERELFIRVMEERFAKYPVGPDDLGIWAEPGKYERQLGVTVQQTETFHTNPPNIMFSHEEALGYQNLGQRKRLGELRALTIPYWGDAAEVLDYYNV